MSTSRRTADPRHEKVAVVDEVRTRLSAADAAILTEYRGLTVKDLANLRRGLRDAGGDYRVYKNTLVRFAVRELGIDGLEELLTGPTGITFIEGDAVGVAKALRDFARTNPALIVKGGVLGTSVLSAADTAALAEIPPRDVLLSRMAGLISAPMQQFAGLLQAVPRNFAYGLKALIELRGPDDPATGATPADDAAAPEPGAEKSEPGSAVEPSPPPVEDASPAPTDESPAAAAAESNEKEGA